MAKIIEEILIIKFSKIVKDSDNELPGILDQTMEKALEEVAQELAGSATIVEIEKP